MAKPRTKRGKVAKVKKVLSEYKRGSLKSSTGRKVTSKKQAQAIALSSAGVKRKKGK